MQVVKPRDIEDALRVDLNSLMPSARCYAPPRPYDLRSGDVLITALGGAPVTPAVMEHDVSVDCWATTEAEAAMLANAVCGYVNALPLMDTATEWKTARANPPYSNPDPDRPTLPRYTFSATVAVRGEHFF